MKDVEVEKINNLYKRLDELEKENKQLKEELIGKLDILVDAALRAGATCKTGKKTK